MSSEALYEQYKDALKRGHVASLRGRIDDALLAYAEAARIAPERSTPHASAGTALFRRQRPAEALRHYEVALSIAPRDETALLGRAQALAAMARRGEAADAFDTLAEVQAAGGRLADAVDAARRGLELAEGRERRRTLERLIARLRATEPGEPGRIALERALQVLEGPAVPAPRTGPATAGIEGEGLTESEAPSEIVSSPEAEPERIVAAEPAEAPEPPTAETPAEAEAPAELEASIAAEAPGEPEADAGEAVVGATAEQSAEPAAARPADDAASGGGPAPSATLPAPKVRVVPDGVTAAELTARAEAASEAGIPGAAVDALLDLAVVHERDGRTEAALDACYAALSFDPDSITLHLALAGLYTAQGWDALATEKLDLLERLAGLDGDAEALAEIAAVRAAGA